LIGKCFYKKGEYSDALKHIREQVSVEKRVSKQESKDDELAMYYSNIGKYLLLMSKLNEALATYILRKFGKHK